MLAEMATDELQRSDLLNDNNKNNLLIALRNRMQEMVNLKEVDLDEVFKAPSQSGVPADERTTQIDLANPETNPEADSDETKKAA